MYKSLKENLKNRLSALDEETERNSDLYSFVKWQSELNEE